jgi:hypothetical protein
VVVERLVTRHGHADAVAQQRAGAQGDLARADDGDPDPRSRLGQTRVRAAVNGDRVVAVRLGLGAAVRVQVGVRQRAAGAKRQNGRLVRQIADLELRPGRDVLAPDPQSGLPGATRVPRAARSTPATRRPPTHTSRG